jgi:DNA (cytosine-5)-methyltransferase 1
VLEAGDRVTAPTVLDLFCGPGGWSEGIRSIGLADIGIEWDAAACATRSAAWHATIRADVEQYPPERCAGRFAGLIASPPCQDFSVAGSRAGVDGDRGRLVIQALRWALHLRPEWVAFEQVPPVLPIWESYAAHLRHAGYSTWTGILCAADFGVPQTRRRAILMASRVQPAVPPASTHAKNPAPSLFGALQRWVSMADALGWGFTDEPANTLVTRSSGGGARGSLLDGGSGARRKIARARASSAWVPNPGRAETQPSRRTYALTEPAPTVAFGHDAKSWAWEQPATTVTGDPRITARCHHENGSQGADAKTTAQVRAGDYSVSEPIRLTIAEALILQGFPADYPVQGSRTKQFEQIGNAVPPPLAAAIVAALTEESA